MTNDEKKELLSDFLNQIYTKRRVELFIYEQSDYGDGEDYYNPVDGDEIVEQYLSWSE